MVNINTATDQMLLNLGLTQEQVDSMLDWREAATTSTRQEGGKDEFYNQLPNRYNAKLGRFDSVDELLLVKGFTPPVLYAGPNDPNAIQQRPTDSQARFALAYSLSVDSYAPNLNPQGNGRINLNQANLNAQQLANALALTQDLAQAILTLRASFPQDAFARLSQVFQSAQLGQNLTVVRSIVDNATVSQQTRIEGRINVNTAPIDVLSAVPGITTDIANSIVGQQTNSGYSRLSDLLSLSNDPEFRIALADTLTTQSNCFEIRSVGEVGSSQVTLVATVYITNGQVRVVRVQEAPFTDMPARWEWDDAVQETVLQEAA